MRVSCYQFYLMIGALRKVKNPFLIFYCYKNWKHPTCIRATPDYIEESVNANKPTEPHISAARWAYWDHIEDLLYMVKAA